MMDEFRELYQEIIMDHNRSPKNFRKIENAGRVIDGTNPLCGDHYTIYLVIENGIIKDISFQGAGCAISKASASVMSETIKGKTVQEAEHLFELFHGIITGEKEAAEYADELGKLIAFAGVAEFPVRVKCATLPWHTMHTALNSEASTISTE
ncbi:MAG: Fe-S cluster assembly sulfur transfer protein SufU [Calditrichaceae bacterium]